MQHIDVFGMTLGAEIDRRINELVRKIASRSATDDEVIEYNRLMSRRVKLMHVDPPSGAEVQRRATGR